MKLKPILIFVLSLAVLVLIGRALFMKKSEPVTTIFVDSGTVTATSTATSAATAEASATPGPALPDTLSVQEKEQIQVLAEILKSKNDNDPRMDQVLKNLSPAVKAALQKQYQETKMEMRNDRGTIAFLIGRELKDGRGSAADIEFLKNVLMEKACMSLVDCSKTPTSQSPEETHLEAIHETTAHYPQLMDLRYLKQALESESVSAEQKSQIKAALESAKNSPNPRVVQEAQSILDSIRK